MDFLGEHKCKIDNKGRLKLPVDFKNQLAKAGKAEMSLVVTRGMDKCLEIYPFDEWDKLRNAMKRKLNKFNPKHRKFIRSFTNGATELKLDAADRLNFPNTLLDYAGIKGEAYLTPGQGTLEMWSSERYAQNFETYDPEEYQDLAAEVMGALNLYDDDKASE